MYDSKKIWVRNQSFVSQYYLLIGFVDLGIQAQSSISRLFLSFIIVVEEKPVSLGYLEENGSDNQCRVTEFGMFCES